MADSEDSARIPEKGITWKQKILKIPHLGTLMGVFGGLCYGSANFTQKLITNDVHPMQSNACTFTFAIVIQTIYATISKNPPVPASGDYLMTTVVAVAQTTLLICLVNSLSYIPAFDETVLVDTAPAFTAFIAWIWLRQKMTIFDMVIILFAITGVILVSQPSFLFSNHVNNVSAADKTIGSLLALCGSISLAIYACALSKIKTTTVLTLTFYSFLFIIISNIILGFSLGVMKVDFSGDLLLKYFISALFYVLNFNVITMALKIEKGVYVVVAQVCDLPTVLILQMAILNDFPNTLAYIGAAFVIISVATIALKDILAEKCCQSASTSAVDPQSFDLESFDSEGDQLISN